MNLAACLERDGGHPANFSSYDQPSPSGKVSERWSSIGSMNRASMIGVAIVGPVYLSIRSTAPIIDAYCAVASAFGAGAVASAGRGVVGAGLFIAFLTGAFAILAGVAFLGADFGTVTLAEAFFAATFAGGDVVCFGAVFLTAVFLAAAWATFAASARFSAHRFLVAATIAALPALLSFRLGFGAAAGAGSADFFAAAHLFRCASAIAFLPATLILRLGFASPAGAAVGVDACVERSPNWRSMSAIRRPISSRLALYPTSAISRIEFSICLRIKSPHRTRYNIAMSVAPDGTPPHD